MTPPRRFGIPLVGWLVGLSAATFLSVVGGIIAGAVHGAWGWMGVTVFLGVVLVAETYALFHRADQDAVLEKLVGPLPARDEIDSEWLALHLRAWSEEG